MVQSIMLIVLGFLLATLIFLLLAPVVWRRAARLATKRLKESLPISLTDFHAEKDQLRADHAIQVRGLEVGLELAKDKNARQMVDIGRQRAENMALTAQIRELRSALSERKSLISVMEQTLNVNVPRMKERMENELGANIQLTDTVAALEGTLKKTTHQLEEADRDIKLREAEIQKLRQAVSIRPPSAGAMFTLNRGRKEKVRAASTEDQDIDLAALDLAEGEKAAVAVRTLQQENNQLREVIAQTKAQLVAARSFEDKEVPLLRQEMRQLGADVLKLAVPEEAETQAQSESAPEPAAKRAPEKKKAAFAPLPTVNGKLGSEELQKAKRSLADRLKGVRKIGGEVDA